MSVVYSNPATAASFSQYDRNLANGGKLTIVLIKTAVKPLKPHVA